MLKHSGVAVGQRKIGGLALRRTEAEVKPMNLDDQIRRYFGAEDLANVPAAALEAGVEHMKVDLGLTKDHGERFALWSLLYLLGSAPDLDVAFANDEDREAARNFMDLVQGAAGP